MPGETNIFYIKKKLTNNNILKTRNREIKNNRAYFHTHTQNICHSNEKNEINKKIH